MKIMVIAPHPDDDIIGCGGSIARHTQQNHEVTIVYMTSGDAGNLAYSKKDLGNLREKEARQAATLLGVDDLIFLRNPDGYIQFNPDNLISLINLLREKCPHRVYLPHQHDLHQDHHVTHQVVMEAINRASGPWFQECQGEPWPVKEVLGYEVWTPITRIGAVQDITPYINVKIAALNCHTSQIESIRYDEAVQGLNRYRGVMTGQGHYCECFEIIKTIL